jgi:hypothetical protein
MRQIYRLGDRRATPSCPVRILPDPNCNPGLTALRNRTRAGAARLGIKAFIINLNSSQPRVQNRIILLSKPDRDAKYMLREGSVFCLSGKLE